MRECGLTNSPARAGERDERNKVNKRTKTNRKTSGIASGAVLLFGVRCSLPHVFDRRPEILKFSLHIRILTLLLRLCLRKVLGKFSILLLKCGYARLQLIYFLIHGRFRVDVDGEVWTFSPPNSLYWHKPAGQRST